ncbi:PfkB family carbohydrate kinase, partial [Novosphingobium sp. 1949]
SGEARLPEAAWALLGRVRAVHWGALGCPGLQAQGPAFLAAARAAGAFVSCDLISPGPQSAAEVAALLPHVDLFMPSLAELPLLAGTADPARAAAHFLDLGARGCIVKQGGAGATLYTRPDRDLVAVHVPALPITPRDTTSCGDSLCAGFHAGRLNGLDPVAALHVAGAVAASVAMGVGTLGALESFAQARALAERQAVPA